MIPRSALIPLVLLTLQGFAWSSPTRPNVIFILTDDLGYGDLGCYGQTKIQTPNIDRLAEEGMTFTDFYAGSTVCAPSRCTLMTGLHTGHAFIRGNGRQDLRAQDVTIAEALKERGYATGLVGKWGLGHEATTGIPTSQGFDSFFGYLDQRHAHNYYPTFLVRNERRVPLPNVVANEGKHGQGMATEKKVYSHDLLTDDALEFIDRHAEEPFFLYLAYTIPHANNEARKRGMEVPDYGPYADRDWPEPAKGFAGMIHRLDRDVGRILERVRERGIDEKTVIFFSSDNGPHREGGHNPALFASSGPLRGIKRDLYEGGIRVPLLARWPGRIEAGSKTDHVSAFWDVFPTLLQLAGAEESGSEDLDGISFAPTLIGEGEQREHDSLFWAFYERKGARAVRLGSWKAVEQPYGSPIQLYDLSKDLGETNDVAVQHPEVVARARKVMDESYRPSARWKFPSVKK